MKLFHIKLAMERVHAQDDDCCGAYFDKPRPTIQINTAYSRQVQLRTQIHEYFHALFRLVHDPDDDGITEEQAARLFELGVEDLVVQNWELLQALKGEE